MFPWEIDAQPDAIRRHKKGFYRRKQAGMAHRRKKNYTVSGHPQWYPEYLKTNHWKQFKIDWRAKNLGARKCCICGDKNYELHHRTYDRIGCERFEDVVGLCRGHHARAHKREKEGVALINAHLI